MANVAIIPARGGSKRIPRKNIKHFLGKPMISYSITAALKSQLFDRVIVSTDDEEIATVAKAYGAEVPFMRPAALADDHTGTGAVIDHALEYLKQAGESVDYACCIYATAPLLQVEYLVQAYQQLKTSNKQFAFSVTHYQFPILRSLRQLPDGGVEPMWPEHIGKRSQDLEEAIHDAGQFYWGKAEAFASDSGYGMFSTDAIPIVLPRYLVQDIDTEEDWAYAELMYKLVCTNK